MSFSKQLSNAAKEVLAESDEHRRAVIVKLFNSIIADTPVKTGRARGNWQCTLGAPSNGLKERADQNKIPVKQDGGSAQDDVVNTVWPSAPDTTAYLTNNLPYIERLEFGYSGQSPAGMVRVNMARIDQVVREAKSKK